ncbi:MAG: DUF2232 domain-containing protein [candidate division Zixibacteria bacterium]|nr:DUF2232 domain-containing protein [candidate division Zixibacteria bacterium]
MIPTTTEIRQSKQNKTSFLLPTALAVVSVNSIVSGMPILNYIFGLLALVSYPVLFHVSGKNYVYTVAVISVFVAAIIGGLTSAILMLVSSTIPGVILGWAMTSGKRPSQAIILSFLPSFIILGFLLLNSSELGQAFHMAMEETSIQFSRIQGSSANSEELMKSLQSFGNTVFDLMPSLILLSGLFNVFIGYMASNKILSISGYQVRPMPPFNRWRPGYPMVGLFITGLFFAVFNLGGSELIGWNILLFTGIIYFISGLAVVESFFRASKIPLFFKLLFYAGVFLAQLFSLVVLAGVGLFDSWFNFRSRQAS